MDRIEESLAGHGVVGKYLTEEQTLSFIYFESPWRKKNQVLEEFPLVFNVGAYHRYYRGCTAISIYRNLTHCYYDYPPTVPASVVPSDPLLLLYFILPSVCLKICIQRRHVKVAVAGNRR